MSDPALAIRLGTSDHRGPSPEESLRKWKILKDVPSQILDQVKTAAVGYCELRMVGFLVTYSDHVYVVGKDIAVLGLPKGSATTTRGKRNPALSGLQIQEFSIGWDFVAAKTIGGEVLTWGDNDEGQLGLSSNSNAAATTVPHKVQGALRNEKIQKISVSGSHCLCLTNSGKVISWGRNDFGQLGQPLHSDTIPQEVQFPQTVEIANVCCTVGSSFALTKDGQLYAWGSNEDCELGDGTHESRSDPQIVKFPGNVKISKVVCGYNHILAISTDGALFAWGWNYNGQAGVNNTTNVLIPTRVDSIHERVIEIASCSYSFVSACKTESKVYVWGFIDTETILELKETSFATIEEAFASYNIGMPNNETWHSDENNPFKPESDLKSLFEDPANTNVAFQVDGQRVLGYRFLLERCAAFKIKFAGEWSIHSVSNPIVITDAKYPEFKAFVKFLHSDEIDIPQEHMIALLRLAHKYDMKLLKKKVADILGETITSGNAIEIYQAASECQVLGLWETVLKIIGSNYTSIMKKTKDKTVSVQLLQDFDTFGIDYK